MFKRLDRNMQGVLLAVVVAYIVLSSWGVYRTMVSSGTTSLQRMSVQYTGQQHQNAELFMRWLEETVQVVEGRDEIREALAGGRIEESVQRQLDGLRASNVDLAGIILYGQRGVVYSSGSIAGVTTLEQLSEAPDIGAFLRAGRAGEWMALGAHRFYYSSGGANTRRSLFYFTRIIGKDGSDLGLLQIETSLPKLIGLFRSEAGTIYGGNRPYLVTADGQWLDERGLPAEVSDRVVAAAAGMRGARGEADTAEGILLTYPLAQSKDRIAILIPSDRMTGELRKLGIVLIAVDAVMVLLFVWLVRRLSLSVTEPLKALYHKMRGTMKEP